MLDKIIFWGTLWLAVNIIVGSIIFEVEVKRT
jgi:hypothetical protein